MGSSIEDSLIPFGYGASDKGNVSEVNEDAFFIDNDSALYIICDGLGGHKAGDIASAKCIEVVIDYISSNIKAATDYSKLLSDAIKQANSILYEISQNDLSFNKMGTTIVMALIKNEEYYAAWVGDSRLYLFRDNTFTLLTKDHSKVQMLIDAGITTKEKAWRHPERNVILSAVGITNKIEPGVISGFIKIQDLFILCSDGIHGEIKDHEIIEILEKNMNIENAVNDIIQHALAAGGSDNATVIAVEVKEL